MGAGCSAVEVHNVAVGSPATLADVRSAVKSIESWHLAQESRKKFGDKTTTSHETLLAKLGGNDILKQVAERWYAKLKRDERLGTFLADQDTIHLRARLSAYLANLFGQKHDPMAALLRKQATSQALQHQRSSVLQHQPTSNGLALHSSQPSLVTSRAPSHAMSRLPPSYSLHHQATSSRVGAGRCHHLRRVHLRLIQQMGFSPVDFDAGLGYFRESLQELGAPEWLVDEVMLKLVEVKDLVFDDPDAPTPAEEEAQGGAHTPEQPPPAAARVARRSSSSVGLLGITLTPVKA